MNVTRHPLCNAATARMLKAVPADETLIAKLQASFEKLTAEKIDLATRFYDRLFSKHPGVRVMFPADMSHQKRKLLDTLGLVVTNLRSPETTLAHLEQLGRTHVSFGVRPEHYPLVVDALVATMAEAAGRDWTAELQSEWSHAMNLVAAIMLEGAAKIEAGGVLRPQGR